MVRTLLVQVLLQQMVPQLHNGLINLQMRIVVLQLLELLHLVLHSVFSLMDHLTLDYQIVHSLLMILLTQSILY